MVSTWGNIMVHQVNHENYIRMFIPRPWYILFADLGYMGTCKAISCDYRNINTDDQDEETYYIMSNGL